jgi:hypothetical protein
VWVSASIRTLVECMQISVGTSVTRTWMESNR